MAGGILKVNLVTPRGVIAHTDADSVQAPVVNRKGGTVLRHAHV